MWTMAGSSVAGGRCPPLLVGHEGALDDGALGVGGGAGGVLAPAFAPASAPGRFLVLLDGDLAREPAPWAVPVPRAQGVPLCQRAPRPVSSGAVQPGRARASIMGDEHRCVSVGPAPRQRPGDAAVDHRVDPRARPHAMAGPLNEPVPATSASAPCAAGPVGPTLVGADDARIHAHAPVEAATLTGPRPGAVTFPHRPPRPIAPGRTAPRHPRTAGRQFPQNLAVITNAARPAPAFEAVAGPPEPPTAHH